MHSCFRNKDRNREKYFKKKFKTITKRYRKSLEAAINRLFKKITKYNALINKNIKGGKY